MAALFSENAQTILKLLQANPNADLTAQDIADATGLPVKTVNGCVTSALQRKGFTIREEQPEKVDGKVVKFIRLTAEGAAISPDAEKPEKTDE